MNAITFISFGDIRLRLSEAAELRAVQHQEPSTATKRLDGLLIGLGDSQRRIAAILRNSRRPYGEAQLIG